MDKQEIRMLIEQFYDIQKLRIQAGNQIAAWLKQNIDKEKAMEILKANGIQVTQNTPVYGKLKDIAIRNPKTIDLPAEMETHIYTYENLLKIEKKIYYTLKKYAEKHPFAKNYLLRIHGIGPVAAATVLAYLAPLDKKPDGTVRKSVSDIWAYCGLTPGSVRRKGQKAKYNPKLKTLMWRIARSLVMRGKRYRQIYLEKKAELLEKRNDLGVNGKGKKAHADALARRKTVKVFLSHAYEVWWLMYNGKRPPLEPYAFTKLGHRKESYIPPFVEKPEYKEINEKNYKEVLGMTE